MERTDAYYSEVSAQETVIGTAMETFTTVNRDYLGVRFEGRTAFAEDYRGPVVFWTLESIEGMVQVLQEKLRHIRASRQN